jgi:hypothetical protein
MNYAKLYPCLFAPIVRFCMEDIEDEPPKFCALVYDWFEHIHTQRDLDPLGAEKELASIQGYSRAMLVYPYYYLNAVYGAYKDYTERMQEPITPLLVDPADLLVAYREEVAAAYDRLVQAAGCDLPLTHQILKYILFLVEPRMVRN